MTSQESDAASNYEAADAGVKLSVVSEDPGFGISLVALVARAAPEFNVSCGGHSVIS